MKILFAGGGTGGHFYPIIAVAEALNALSDKEHIVGLSLYYMSDDPYNKDLLFKNRISYIEVRTGKRRTYFSIKNFTDPFKTLLGCIIALWKVFRIYPDVVFGKGGYASFPALFAARILRIPVIVHESDIIPGKVNRWISAYAAKVAISYPEAIAHFPHKDRVALTGNPILKEMMDPVTEDPVQLFHLEPEVPILLVLGGSQGSERINETVMDVLPKLVAQYQIIHQTGKENYPWMKKRAEGMLSGNIHAARYKAFAYLEQKTLRAAAQASSLIISRAGSTIFEIAIWGKPSILIPLAIARDDHQRENAYSYSRMGACTVIEEKNLKAELFYSVIEQLMRDPQKRAQMSEGAKSFVHTDAATIIAKAILSIAIKHA